MDATHTEMYTSLSAVNCSAPAESIISSCIGIALNAMHRCCAKEDVRTFIVSPSTTTGRRYSSVGRGRSVAVGRSPGTWQWRTFDRRVVMLDKLVLHVPDREGRLAYTSSCVRSVSMQYMEATEGELTSEDDNLVFAHHRDPAWAVERTVG